MPSGAQVELHPIQVVVHRAGVSAALLRAWEKRYGAIEPTRSQGGHRLYSDADIERLRLIKAAMGGGRRIGDVAALPTAEIARLVREDTAGRPPSAEADPRASGARSVVADAIDAVRRADQGALRAILSRDLLSRTPERFASEVATPLMRSLGELWRQGDLTPAHEHAASEVVRRLLHDMLDMLPAIDGAPGLVVATSSGQRHELGALFAAAVAALDGWRVTYLGADLPAADIARVATEVGARAVALSVTVMDAGTKAELTALRGRLGTGVSVLVGGQQATALAGALRHVEVVKGVDDLRAVLRRIAPAPAIS